MSSKGNCCDNVILKVLSSGMDLAKSGLIRKVLIKVRDAEIFSEFRPPPM